MTSIFIIADLMDVVLEIHRRTGLGGDMRWYAGFRGAYEKQGGLAAGVVGNGATPWAALRDYARRIAGKPMMFDLFSEGHRRDFLMPLDLGVPDGEIS